MDLYARMAVNPALVASMSMGMWSDYMKLWQSTWMKMFGMNARPVAEPVKGDARFKDEDWSSNFVFDHIKQSYLIAARHLQQTIARVEGLPPESEKKIAFFTRQYVDALAPSNFLLTNPQVLRETVQSGGQNLVRGLNNLLSDLEKGGGELRISMTDENAFQLGRNVATTPGKVVYQTPLMQLIQYQPATEEVYKRPLVIIPPWINKYYILDLREKNSFIRWAVQQGLPASWCHGEPGSACAQGFDDYMPKARSRLRCGEKRTDSATSTPSATAGARCAAPRWAARQHNQDGSARPLFVSLLDFSQPGELGVFIDEAQVVSLEKKMNERGYLEGFEMAGTFNLLRANDLVWSFVVNNYLLGKDPFPFDLLYWNADSTRMPARMHSFYLRNMYLHNLLGEPGGIELDGVPIDLSAVKVPSYFISTVEDHIAPWQSTYKGAKYLGGPVRFVLGGSGHIAGIVNPPASKKYHYWASDALPETAEEWFAGAKQTPGSWWEDCGVDCRQNAAAQVTARVPQIRGRWPGSYATMRSLEIRGQTPLSIGRRAACAAARASG